MDVKHYIPGFLVVVIIAALSYYLSTIHASFDPLVVSIIIGMFLGNTIGLKDYFERGVEGSLKVFLPAGIALYGTQLVLRGVEWGFLAAVFLTFISLFGLTLLVSAVFSVDRKVAVLLASGLAVCGASAIAVISPLIGAKREDTSISVISVMMLGLTGMIFYPVLSDSFLLSKGEFAFLAGTTLPMLGQVKVTASNVCQECASQAVGIKLIRVSFLFFLVAISAFLSGREGRKIGVSRPVVLFVVFAGLVNLVRIPLPAAELLKAASSFFLAAALGAIGFSADFESIVERGITPLGVIFVSWGATILLLYLARNVF